MGSAFVTFVLHMLTDLEDRLYYKLGNCFCILGFTAFAEK